MTGAAYLHVQKQKNTQTGKHACLVVAIWPLMVRLDIFPSFSVQHLLLFCIPLSSFNKITFTISPAHIIY